MPRHERRALHRLATAFPAFAAALFMALSPPGVLPVAQAATVLQGPARVVDGDTLNINGESIRFFGVDAPEKAQSCRDARGSEYSCGLRSKEMLTSKVGSQVVTCNVKNKDMYGRSVSVCSVGGGPLGGAQELNAWMVSNGWAVAYREYSKEYIPLEDKAKAEKIGVWAGPFTYPADWRKQQKSPGVPPLSPKPAPRPAPASLPSCPGGALPIKGNIGSKGDKIYHVPGSAYYNQVKIDIADGERFFCTEGEAKSAGFRAPL